MHGGVIVLRRALFLRTGKVADTEQGRRFRIGLVERLAAVESTGVKTKSSPLPEVNALLAVTVHVVNRMLVCPWV